MVNIRQQRVTFVMVFTKVLIFGWQSTWNVESFSLSGSVLAQRTNSKATAYLDWSWQQELASGTNW